MSKKLDSFICPRCGKQTIEAVQQWEHDFLAIHEVRKVKVKSQGGIVECAALISACDAVGKLPRTPREFEEIEIAKAIKVKKIQEESEGLF